MRNRRWEHKDSDGRLEQKRLSKPYQVKATDDAAGRIEGYGAIFNDPHPTSSWALDFDWLDVIAEGAFTKTLKEHTKRGTLPLMLYMHERGNIHGAWRSALEDKTGLALIGEVAKSALNPSGAPTYELLKMGALNGLSIGFRVRKAELDEEAKTRTIVDVELAEVSIVDIPGGPSARVTDVKGDPHSIRFLETVLCDAGLSRKEAKALLAQGFGALRDAAATTDEPTQRDAGKPIVSSTTSTEALAKSIVDFAKSIRSK